MVDVLVYRSAARADLVHRPALREKFLAHLQAFPVQAREVHGQLKRAAVALTLAADENGQSSFLLTRRASRLRAHSGQWALPGGRFDPGEDAVDAALRELQEEIGLNCRRTEVLGRLDDYETRSGYVITPVVVWSPDHALFRPNEDEVESLHHVPLAELEREDAPEILPIPESDRPILRMPIADNSINTPTAAFLYQFREVCLHGRATRVDGYDQPVFAWR
ncbi:MAG: CoA pyrophosphatase [Reyranellaceae bacterium]